MARNAGNKIEIEGLREFMRDLKRFEPAIQKRLMADLRKVIKDIAAEARQDAPRDTGELQRGIKASVRMKDLSIVSSARHAWIIEKGGRHPVYGRDNWVFQPAQPHIFPAVDKHKDDVYQAMIRAVDAAIREIGFR